MEVSIRRVVSTAKRRFRSWSEAKDMQHWAQRLSRCGGISVCYLTPTFPSLGNQNTIRRGGVVKLDVLASQFPHNAYNCSIVYLVSSVQHPGFIKILKVAKKRGIKIVLNQNGVYYKAWYGRGWKYQNLYLRRILRLADHVIFQSEFSRLCTEKFLGAPRNYDVITNCVDVELFKPSPTAKHAVPFRVLMAGSTSNPSWVECALKAVSYAKKAIPRIEFILAGKLSWTYDERNARDMVRSMASISGLQSHELMLLGPYTQAKAIEIMQSADVFIHPRYNDVCPTVVLEAMASGLPIVFSDSGGVRELVGDSAGVGVPSPHSWDRQYMPDPIAMGEAIIEVSQSHATYSLAARHRAVEVFSVAEYFRKHEAVFSSLLRE